MQKAIVATIVGIILSISCFILLGWGSWWQIVAASFVGTAWATLWYDYKEVIRVLKSVKSPASPLFSRSKWRYFIKDVFGTIIVIENLFLWAFVPIYLIHLVLWACFLHTHFLWLIAFIVWIAPMILGFSLSLMCHPEASLEMSVKYVHDVERCPISTLLNEFTIGNMDRIFNGLDKKKFSCLIGASIFTVPLIIARFYLSLITLPIDLFLFCCENLASKLRITVSVSTATGSIFGCIQYSLSHDPVSSYVVGITVGSIVFAISFVIMKLKKFLVRQIHQPELVTV